MFWGWNKYLYQNISDIASKQIRIVPDTSWYNSLEIFAQEHWLHLLKKCDTFSWGRYSTIALWKECDCTCFLQYPCLLPLAAVSLSSLCGGHIVLDFAYFENYFRSLLRIFGLHRALLNTSKHLKSRSGAQGGDDLTRPYSGSTCTRDQAAKDCTHS